jgi:hypothetical protein
MTSRSEGVFVEPFRGQDKSRRRRGRKPGQVRGSKFDTALIEAKNKGYEVDAWLALSTEFTDEEGYFRGKVLEVDTYSVKFSVNGSNSFWVNKAFLVSAGILS